MIQTYPSSSSSPLIVGLGDRSYPIHIGAGVIEQAARVLPGLAGRRVFILYDQAVESYADALTNALTDHAFALRSMGIKGGEGAKSYNSLIQILDWLLSERVDRQSLLCVVGGGVMGDVGGFAASIVLRGIDCVQIPTTLLSQVDSSVGGKTGINAAQGKNLVGSFYQPLAVLCDTNTLKTLSIRERRAGYAEIVKYGLLGDAGFFDWLDQHGQRVLDMEEPFLAHAIEKSCAMKAKIVGMDEREKIGGARALLNLGHTFAHALESSAGFDGRLLHGEAVGIGLVLAARLSAALRLCPSEDAVRVESHLKSMGMMTEISHIAPSLSCTAADLMHLMARDKKAIAGSIHFILLRGIGDAFQSDAVDMSDVQSILEHSLKG